MMELQRYIDVFTAMKIHASHSTKTILETFGTFVIEKRGDLEIKVFDKYDAPELHCICKFEITITFIKLDKKVPKKEKNNEKK